MILPMGAPRPLLKHNETESKRLQKSVKEPWEELAAATSQMRAPSMCSLIECWRAKVAMALISERGRMVPWRVFSRLMMRVGHAWISSEMMALALMSARVRWWLLLGRTGMIIAPERLETPPASYLTM